MAELSCPQLTPAEMGEGGGALTKTAATLKREESEREREATGGEKPKHRGGVAMERARWREQERLGVQVYQNMT